MSESIQEEVAEALREILVPKKAKKKVVPKYIMVVNGTVVRERPVTKADLIKAAKAVVIRNPEAKLEVDTYSGPSEVDMPVSGAAVEGDA